jgi:predicted component of type VI protein secretion system
MSAMAKLTVFFKDKAIQSSLFENGVVHIGRDETNDLAIDSLAVAPAHAALIIRNDSCTIKQLNDDYPLIVNGKKHKECSIHNDDTISIGKHDIIFNTTESPEEQAQNGSLIDKDVIALNQEISNDRQHIPSGNLQALDGRNIGKILPLKKAMTRLGHSGNAVVAIARRKDGYFISALENNGTITINNQPLNDNSLKLNDNDVIVIDSTSLQFFLN